MLFYTMLRYCHGYHISMRTCDVICEFINMRTLCVRVCIYFPCECLGQVHWLMICHLQLLFYYRCIEVIIVVFYQIKGPSGDQIYDARDKASDKFEFVVQNKGVHRFCFANKSPYFETVDFDVHIGHFSYFEEHAKDGKSCAFAIEYS